MSTPIEVAARLADEGVYLNGARDAKLFEAVMERVGGDPDLAADAILLVSRPQWLRGLIGEGLRPKVSA